MNGNGSAQQRRRSQEAAGSADTSDSDSISLASTVEETHDSDQEFEVEGIRGEKLDGDGVKFLVEWSHFPLDQCTWEPDGSLGPELRSIWDERKATSTPEELARLVREVEDAIEEVHGQKAERHRRRNAKRRRLGLAPTSPIEEEKEPPAPVSVSPDHESSDEAAEDNEVDPGVLGAAMVALPAKGKQRVFGTIPLAPEPPTVTPKPKQPSAAPVSKPSVKKKPSASLPPLRHASSSTAAMPPSQRAVAPSSTGYQGTAMKTAPSGSTASSSNASTATRAGSATKFGPPSKTLTAKKSAQSKPNVTNVFVSGKTRKARKSLSDAMCDPARDPKLFAKHRTVWQAEKRSRDKADQAPDITALQGSLFEISKGPQEKISLQGASEGSAHLANGTSRASHTPPAQASPAQPSGPIPTLDVRTRKSAIAVSATPSVLEDTERPKRLRKSVRFLEEETPLVEEPMGLDTSEASVYPAPLSAGQSRGASWSAYPRPPTPPPGARQDSRATRSVSKTVDFSGGKDSSAVTVTFSGVPVVAPPGIRSFLAQEPVPFGSMCLAQTLVDQLSHVRTENLCSGSITADGETGDKLERGAERLRATLSGLFYAHPDFNLVVFPTRCDAWKADMLGTEPQSPEGVSLRYVLFSSSFDLGPFLRPATVSATESRPGHERDDLMRMFFGMDFEKLCPVSSTPAAQHFFLVFPESKKEIMMSLYLWLRTCNPLCQIYTSFQAGSWSVFTERTKQDPGHVGVVLVHESLAWTVRRFPGLSELLQASRNYNFWVFSGASQVQPIYPSTSPVESTTDPGHVELVRLFPHGTAILLTPSFMVSEPAKTRDFFYWFFKHRARTSSNKLVLARDVRQFIRTIAEEKTAKRLDLMQDRRYSIIEQSLQENLHAVTEADCHAMWQVFHMIWLNLDLREERSGPYPYLEEDGPVVYADACIDANDEQSLVNWFGWWSTLRADQYRKFYVVGSSISMAAPQAKKGCRRLKIPRYSNRSINNPDTVLETLEMANQPETTDAVSEADGEPPAPPAPREPHKGPWRFESERFEENPVAWSQWLASLDCARPWRLYAYPVAWPGATFEQADHFGDHRRELKRYSEWFSWAYPFVLEKGRSFNTYIGFFYTILGAWDPRLYPQGQRPQRHAWIGVYRLANCHLFRPAEKPTKCEVIIWDASAKSRLAQKHDITENDLTPAQRQFIQYLREEGPKKNAGTHIDKVWLGGFDYPPCQSQFQFDVTATFLEKMTEGIKTYLPAPEHVMPKRGYRKLVAGTASGATNGVAAARSSSTASLDPAEEDPEDVKIIFHPPRGTCPPLGEPKGVSKCRNHLYETARLARLRDKNAETMNYTYKPTLEWYEDQRAEDRSFEHMAVDTWEAIFNVLKIGSAEHSAKDKKGKALEDIPDGDHNEDDADGKPKESEYMLNGSVDAAIDSRGAWE